MSYRGEDLDLRTPLAAAAGQQAAVRTEPANNAQRARPTASATPSSGPIWVDDEVLECCNHAFEVANAHRAPDVRVEHLVFALTRTDHASAIMERRGVRVLPLRREVATIIATELPTIKGNGASTPRRSEQVEEVLRLASGPAYRRQSAVTVEDVLNVLIDRTNDFPAMARLRGYLYAQTSAPEPLVPQPLPELREAVRPPLFTAEPARPVSSDLTSLSVTPQSYLQTPRIESLEQSLRSISSEMANDRKMIANALQDLQRDLITQRDEITRNGSAVGNDRLQAQLNDRLQGLEYALTNARSVAANDLAQLQDKLAGLERALVQEVGTTRMAINDLAAKTADPMMFAAAPPTDLTPVTLRMDMLEQSLMSRDPSERLSALENAFLSEAARAQEQDASLSASLSALSAQVERQPTSVQAVLQPPLSDQLTQLASAVELYKGQHTEATTTTHDQLSALSRVVDTFVNTKDNTQEILSRELSTHGDQITKLASTFSLELTDLHDSLTKVNTNQHTLASSLDAQSQSTAQAFANLAARIERLERASAKPVAMLETLSTTTDNMHRLMVEKYFRRNRLWYWLFGTDDWLAASWPSQTERISQELQVIKRHTS